jgi:hypothetical protein
MAQMNLFIIIFKVVNLIFFFVLARKYFSKKFTAIFLTIIFFISPWQALITQRYSLVAVFSTILFFIVVTFYHKEKRLKHLVVFISLFIFSSLLFLINNDTVIQNTPFYLNQDSISRVVLYQNIIKPLNPTFSRLYTNKATETVKNMEINVFETLNLNSYFFANHPLERVGVKETEKLYSGLLPLFIMGIISINSAYYLPTFLWLMASILVSSLINNRNYESPILLFVPIMLFTGIGLEKILRGPIFWKKALVLGPILLWIVIEIIIFRLNNNLYF